MHCIFVLNLALPNKQRETPSSVCNSNLRRSLYTENKYFDRCNFVQLSLVLNKRTAGSSSRQEKLNFENIFTNQDAQALLYSGLMYV